MEQDKEKKNKGFLKRFTKEKKPEQEQKKKYQTASNSDVAWAKNIIDKAIVPKLRTIVDALNQTLAERGIRAGLEIVWRFDKDGEEDEE